jgi:hypothetical protein
MMITTMNDALVALKKMNTKQVNSFVYDLECEGWYRDNRRKTRAFCAEVIIFNWDYDRHAILRALYNNI